MGSIADLSTIATHGVATASSFVNDFLIVIVLFGVIFLLAWWGGRAFLMSFLLALYAGYALFTVFPYGSYLPQSPPLTALGASVLVFAVLTAIAYFILHRGIVSDFITMGPIGLVILSFLGAGFLLALAYHVFPVKDVYTFTPAMDALFAAKQYFFFWFAAPLAGLFFLAR